MRYLFLGAEVDHALEETSSLRCARGAAFWVLGFGFRVSGFGFRASGFGFRVSGFGFRVSGSGSRVSVARFPVEVHNLGSSAGRFGRDWRGSHSYVSPDFRIHFGSPGVT